MLTSKTKRVISALFFLPLFILLLLKGSPFHFFLLAAAAALLGLGEFFSLKAGRLPASLKLFGYLWLLLIMFSAYIGGVSAVAGTVTCGAIISLLIRLARTEDINSVIDELGFLSLAILYVGLLFSYIVLLRGLEDGNIWILLLFVVTWGGDTAAYYTGMSMGKRKLYPAISPKKSVEGFLGGFAGGIAAAVFLKIIILHSITFLDSMIIGIIIGIIGPLGDLAESMMKRACDVKDSGRLIPGHGGILDRVDSILFSAPFVYYFAAMRYGGHV